MQAILMAAGRGSRMGAATENIPKSFIQIHGRSLLEHNLDRLTAMGAERIIIVTGFKSELFEAIAAQDERVTLAFNPFYETTNVLASFWAGMHLLEGDFFYLHADTLCEESIMRDMLLAPGDIVLPVDIGNYNEEAMGVRSEGGRISEISKEIPLDRADGEFIGIALIRGRALPALRERTVELMREKAFASYFEAALQRMIDKDDYVFTTVPTRGRFWVEMDFKEDYERAVREMPEELR